MQFASPGRWNGAKGEAWHASMHTDSAHMKFAATVSLDEMRWVVHATVGELSHLAATCVCWRSAKFLRVSQWRRRPAISRSELEIVPVALLAVANCCCSALGKATCQTIDGMVQAALNHTPTPSTLFGSITVSHVVGGGWDEVGAQGWSCGGSAEDVPPVKEGMFGGWVELDLCSWVRCMFCHEGYNW